MKTSALIFAFSVLLLCSSRAEDRFIEVTGKATVKADVDRIAWHLRIRGEGESLDAAAEALKETTEGLVERISALELPGNSMRFSRMQSGRLRNLRDGEEVVTGYFVERGAVIQLDSLEPSHAVESALLVDDGVEIDRLSLESSHYEGLKQRVVVDAVAAARAKAELMVGELGVVLGEVLTVREGGDPPAFPMLTTNRVGSPEFAQGESSDFEEVELTSTVVVRFGIQ
ncbi:MAG: SIMPL domain-containing protein [Verrucomicrobiales bacterium]